MQRLPARRDDLVFEDIQGEVLVYDPRTDRGMTLTSTAGRVFAACDGRASDVELREELGAAALAAAIADLSSAGLLERSGVSRRSMLAGGLAGAGAIAATIVLPTAAAAASGGGTGGGGEGGGTGGGGTGGGNGKTTSGPGATPRIYADSYQDNWIIDTSTVLPTGTATEFRVYCQTGYRGATSSKVYFVLTDLTYKVIYVSPSVTATAGAVATIPANVTVPANTLVGVGWEGESLVSWGPAGSGRHIVQAPDHAGKPANGATLAVDYSDNRDYAFEIDVTA